MNLDDRYVWGFLENLGGFYVNRLRNRDDYAVPLFYIQTGDKDKIVHIEKVLAYLKKRYAINYVKYKMGGNTSFRVTDKNSLVNLISLLEKNCSFKRRNIEEVKSILVERGWK